MYTLINQNIHSLLLAINFERDVRPYMRLMERLHQINVTDDAEFQRLYRLYWQMNPARLNEGYQEAYFRLLECAKTNAALSVDRVARRLYRVPTHNNGRKSLQFSFASKLIHMVQPNKPIYDSMVAAFYWLPSAQAKKDLGQKLQCLMASYRFLDNEYQRVLREHLLDASINDFRQHFPVGATFTDTKVVDTLIWRFASLLRAGAVQEGTIMFE